MGSGPLTAVVPGVVDLVDGIASGAILPSDVLDAVSARHDAVEPALAAWASFDGGRSARAVPPGPLHGIPFGVKDVIATATLPTRYGSAGVFGDRLAAIAHRDAWIVSQLQALGAVLVGKTATTQFASADPAPTVNPLAPDRTPGGSSAGSAAAVAAGVVPFAIGTQTAGSVLRPAAYCGVVGFKPTFDSLPTSGVMPLAPSFDTLGIIARSVADAALVYRSLRPRARGASIGSTAPSQLRIGWLTMGLPPVDREVEEAVGEASTALRSTGATVTRETLPFPWTELAAFYDVMLRAEMADVHRLGIQRERAGYGPKLLAYVESGLLVPAHAYLAARDVRRRLGRAFTALAARFDALLLPTAVALPPDRTTTGDPSLQIPASAFGMPSLSIPCATGGPVPASIQLVAARGRDGALLDVGAVVERVLRPVDTPAHTS